MSSPDQNEHDEELHTMTDQTMPEDSGHAEPPTDEDLRSPLPVRPDPRQPAYDAVYEYLRGLGQYLPPDPVRRNAIIWRAVHRALDATHVGRCVSSHCVEGDHIVSVEATSGPAATESEKTARVLAALHASAEETVTRIIDLYERWVKAGPPQIGSPIARWWDARLAELHRALRPPADVREAPETGSTPADEDGLRAVIDTATRTMIEEGAAPADGDVPVPEALGYYAMGQTLARERAEAERDGAYRERTRLLVLIAQGLAEQAVVAPAADVDEPGWQILYLTLHGRQCSWHISPRDADLVAALEHVAADDPRAQWDGHTTDEKYAWIDRLARSLRN
ncbi:hypothetical protein [Streptomyces griseosporeus]|uniref:hypothetical protein n=1 Tax=Streptomyces griseosporeus TaxID=1910 RepID=UPI0036FF7B7E